MSIFDNFDPQSQSHLMNLCIDVGNSIIKTAVFSGTSIIGKNTWTELGSREIIKLGSDYQGVNHVILSSVRKENRELSMVLEEYFGHLLLLDESTPVPVENLYRTPETLGKDRLAGIVGANNIYRNRNVLVIDAGTAITFDVVDRDNRYLGGNISPGMLMRFRALHEFTGKLPHVTPLPEVPLIAGDTFEAIAAGVQNGIIFEIENYISRISEQYDDLIIIFTGGDAKYFDKKLKNTIFAAPDLILNGLNRILTYNVENY
jgi:type III pantothenate kinase